MRHWPISHLTMSRMCPPCMQISFQRPFRAARSREGEAGQVCVEPHPIVEWMAMVFFFVMNTSGYSQSSSCQACLLASWPFSDLWNQIFSHCWVMWKTLTAANTLYSWKKLLLWHLSTRISFNLLCYLTGWIFLVQWTTGLLLQTRVQQPQPQGPGMLLMSNNAKKHGPATENNKSSLKNKSTGCN